MQEAVYNTNMRNTPRFILIIFLCFFSFHCSFKNKKNPNILTVGLSALPATMDPRFALDAEGMKIGSLIFQSLVTIGPDMNVVGDAAQSWNVRKEASVYKLDFELKPNLKFSTGDKVTCDDLIFSIAQYQSDASPFKSAFSNIVDSSCSDKKLTLTLDSYSEKMLNSDLPVLKILPKKIVTETQDQFKNQIIGSGPFSLITQSESSLLLKPNLHFETPPQLEGVEFKVIKDDFTRFLQMYRGDLDLAISTIPKNKVASLKTLDFIEVIQRPGLKMAYILVNFNNPILSEIKNRQMLFQSLDVAEVIKYKLEGLGEPATSILTTANPYFNKDLLSLLPKDEPQLRDKVLASSASDKILLLKTSNSREAVENAKLLTNQMRQYGFRIRHESYEWGTYFKDIKEGNFDLATMTWVGAYDPDIYRIALSSKELPPSGRNRGFYKNEKFDQLVEAGAMETDSEKRKQLYYQAQAIAVKDLAILPLWYEDTITVFNKRVTHYIPSLNGDYSGLIHARLNLDSEKTL